MDKYLQKVGSFFENYVQFVVLGLAGLLFLWTLWTYVLNPAAATAPLGPIAVGPGDVDARVLATEGETLRRATEQGINTTVRPGQVDSRFGEESVTIQPLGQILAGVFPVSAFPAIERIETDDPSMRLAALPDLPPARVVLSASGRAAADVPGVGVEDVIYVAVRWELPMEELQERFSRVALPANVSRTTLLDVRLVREREISPGSFGERTEVARLRNVSWPTLPGQDVPFDDKRVFLNFARENPDLIALPPFYPISSGDQPEVISADPLEADPDVEAPPTPQPPPRGQRPPRDVDDDGRPIDPQSRRPDPRRPTTGRPPVRPPTTPDGFDPRDFDEQYWDDSGEFSAPEEGLPPNGGTSGVQPVPTFVGGDVPGEFNPARRNATIGGIAYDETAEPGETYRYNVVYALRNPLFSTTNIADNPALEQQLDLVVGQEGTWESAWGEPVTVKELRVWFMRNIAPPSAGNRVQEVRFSVFRWQNGRWNESDFRVAAGETIGGVANNVDYTTGHILVDVRDNVLNPNARTQIGVVVSPAGRLRFHQPNEDQASYNEYRVLASDGGPVAGR